MSLFDGDDAAERAYTDLTQSIRRLIDVAIRTTADPSAVGSARNRIDAAVDELSSALIPGSFGIRQRPNGQPVVWGNAVIGLRNAIAPPMTVHHNSDGRVWADLTLGAAYEGPPGHVHGGICALLLDHILGTTAHKPGQPAVTGTLTLRYEQGTALGPVHAEAHIDRTEGVKTFAVGHLSTPAGVTVRAEGVFIHPRASTL